MQHADFHGVRHSTPLGVIRITRYCATGTTTASGAWPATGEVATLDRGIPFGSKLYVRGLGTFTVTDRIGHGSDIDIYTDGPRCEHKARMFGIKHRAVYLLPRPGV